MSYIDGVVVAVPNANRESYKQFAEDAAEMFRKHGALNLVECWGRMYPRAC